MRDMAWLRLAGGLMAGAVAWWGMSGPVKMDLITTPYFASEWPRSDLLLYGLLSGLATTLYAYATAPSATSSCAHPTTTALNANHLPARIHEPLLQPMMALASVLVNAVVLRRVGKTPTQAWMAAGWVFGGAWIKDDPRFDDTDETAPKGATLGSFDAQGKYVRVSSASISKAALDKEGGSADDEHEAGSGGSVFWRQYAPSLLLPPLLVIFARGLFATGGSTVPPALQGTFVNGSRGLVLLEGGHWELEFHQAITPLCLNGSETKRWHGTRRTALASHERSGNTWTRELVERSTGWQTSTISYCDKTLAPAFKGECDHEANFLM